MVIKDFRSQVRFASKPEECYRHDIQQLTNWLLLLDIFCKTELSQKQDNCLLTLSYKKVCIKLDTTVETAVRECEAFAPNNYPTSITS